MNRVLTSKGLLALRICSFITSLLPLNIYILLEYVNNHNCIMNTLNIIGKFNLKWITPHSVSMTLLIIQILALGFIFYFIYQLKRGKNETGRYRCLFINPIREKTNTTAYVLSNVLPIISINFETCSGIIFVTILTTMLGFMYVKNDMHYINPIYDIFGIYSYTSEVQILDEITDRVLEEKTVSILSNKKLYTSTNIIYLSFKCDDILIVKREEDVL